MLSRWINILQSLILEVYFHLLYPGNIVFIYIIPK